MVYETNHNNGAFSPWYIYIYILKCALTQFILRVPVISFIYEGGKESAKKRFCSKERCIA